MFLRVTTKPMKIFFKYCIFVIFPYLSKLYSSCPPNTVACIIKTTLQLGIQITMITMLTCRTSETSQRDLTELAFHLQTLARVVLKTISLLLYRLQNAYFTNKLECPFYNFFLIQLHFLQYREPSLILCLFLYPL